MGASVSECAAELFAPPNKSTESLLNDRYKDGYLTPDTESDTDSTDNMDMDNMDINTSPTDNDSEGHDNNSKLIQTAPQYIHINHIDDHDEKDNDDSNTKITKTNNNGINNKNEQKAKYMDYIQQNMNPSPETQTFNHSKPIKMSPNKQIKFKIIADDDDDDDDDDEEENIYTINNIHEYEDKYNDDEDDENDDNLSQCSTQATRPMHVTSFDDDILVTNECEEQLIDDIDATTDAQTFVFHNDNSDSSRNSRSHHSPIGYTYNHSPIGYSHNNRSLLPPKSAPVPILHETNTLSFDQLFPSSYHQQIQMQTMDNNYIHNNNNNQLQHIRSRSVEPAIQIYATLHSPESIASSKRYSMPPILSNQQIPQKRYSMPPILNNNNNNNYNHNKRLSVSSDLSISHPSHLPQYPSFSTTAPPSPHGQSLSVYTISSPSMHQVSYPQNKAMRKIHHAPSRSMDGIWNDNIQIIDKSIHNSHETTLRKGKQTQVLTKDNFSNWSKERIHSTQEAMEKQLSFLQENELLYQQQLEHSTKSTNWISPNDPTDSEHSEHSDSDHSDSDHSDSDHSDSDHTDSDHTDTD